MPPLTLKIAATAATNKNGRKIVGIILSIFLGILLLILIAISSLASIFTSFFTGSQSQSSFNAQETEVYKTIHTYYKEYVAEEWQTMTELADKYEAANLVYHTHSSDCGYHTHTDACYKYHVHGDSCYTDYTEYVGSGPVTIDSCGCVHQTYFYKCNLCDSSWSISNTNSSNCKKGHKSSNATVQHEHSRVLTCKESTDKILICSINEGYQCGKTEDTVEYCKAEITVREYQYINTAYILSYLSVKNKKDYLKKKKVNIDKEELFDFWAQISSVQVNEGGTEDRPTYDIYNSVLPLEDMIKLLFAEDTEQQEYRNSVYLMSQLVGQENFNFIGNVGNGGYCNNSMDIPLYYQYSAPWGNITYGNGTISVNGCAPTCIAMVFSYLRGSIIYPDEIVKYTGNKYYVNGQGSSWSIFSACAQHWGISCVQIGVSQNEVADKLSEGKPVILSMGPGMFTSSGHFIVLTGINQNGFVTVNDPNDNSRKNFIDKEFSLSQILSEAKGGWYFE